MYIQGLQLKSNTVVVDVADYLIFKPKETDVVSQKLQDDWVLKLNDRRLPQEGSVVPSQDVDPPQPPQHTLNLFGRKTAEQFYQCIHLISI